MLKSDEVGGYSKYQYYRFRWNKQYRMTRDDSVQVFLVQDVCFSFEVAAVKS